MRGIFISLEQFQSACSSTSLPDHSVGSAIRDFTSPKQGFVKNTRAQQLEGKSGRCSIHTERNAASQLGEQHLAEDLDPFLPASDKLPGSSSRICSQGHVMHV
ncbi:hypothetical protein Y1Q_0001951 [Alligator mississippiensis]|uniref:Uncharacterized protein n=1 Tax=Alligator mississippiensis TaxID=8496 RepID=A0A151PGL9_ALLMI|nr:hypothetical protein Y1Q_0001951 [Alligator mississippiensis]